MTKEELYKLALDSYHEYPLLAELMAIKDERFKDEQQDSMLCVNGYVGLDTLNNYVKLQQENQQLKADLEMYENSVYFSSVSDKLQQENTQLRIEISAIEEDYIKLEDNWTKLKEYAKDNLYFYDGYQGEDLETDIAIQDILNKMQELERSDSK